jgi:hypothetical protein
VKSTSNGNPAAICQGCDYQTGSGTHIFVAVLEAGADLFNSAIVCFFVPVVSELLLPSEIIDRTDIVLNKTLNDITSVHISCDQSHNNLSLKGCQFASDELSEMAELLLVLFIPFLKRKGVR